MTSPSRPQYNFAYDNLFSVILQTSLSRIVKDTPPPAGLEAKPKYTMASAVARYKEITGSETIFNTFSSKTEFEFNNYTADGNYFQHEDITKYEKEYKLSRNLSEDYPLFKKNILNNVATTKTVSDNRLRITLNPKILRLGLNFGERDDLEKKRNEIKSDLNTLLNKGNNKKNFRRIVKIMAFILSRERGSSTTDSSTELLQREYNLICWAIVNAALNNKFSCNGDLLKLLKDKDYTNPYGHVKQEDTDAAIAAENTIMQKIYGGKGTIGTMGNNPNNLELFVMAFWDGYINDELSGYTNWSHAVNKKIYNEYGNETDEIEFTFKNFQLPKYLKDSYDPDAVVDQTLTYKIKDATDNSTLKITAENREYLKISNTSAGDVYTLDGRVLFIKS
jgi:hypothetical protein